MPLITIWCAISPDNLEATSITLFTGLINLSNNFGNYFGSAILWTLQIDEDQFTDLWIPLVIQNVYLLIMTVAVLFVSFPDLDKK